MQVVNLFALPKIETVQTQSGNKWSRFETVADYTLILSSKNNLYLKIPLYNGTYNVVDVVDGMAASIPVGVMLSRRQLDQMPDHALVEAIKYTTLTDEYNVSSDKVKSIAKFVGRMRTIFGESK